MNKLIATASLFVAAFANAQTHKLEKIWETDSVVAIPESVLPDFKKTSCTFHSLMAVAGMLMVKAALVN